jgi:hypothetical protein
MPGQHRKGFGINGKYPNAWSAWQHTQQHFGTPPSGVDVPVFFSYIDAAHGHIGVRLANGTFWSDGNTYESIADYQKRHTPRYVGWGESINDQRVLEVVASPPPAPSSGQTLHLNKGTDTTFYRVTGGTFVIHAKDDSYDYHILENRGNEVRVNSASGGGNGWIYLKYSNTGATIPGRYIK